MDEVLVNGLMKQLVEAMNAPKLIPLPGTDGSTHYIAPSHVELLRPTVDGAGTRIFMREVIVKLTIEEVVTLLQAACTGDLQQEIACKEIKV